MKRYSSNRKTFEPKPVIRAEYDSRIKPVRVIALAAMIIIAASAFAYGIYALVNNGKGWQRIDVEETSEINYGENFYFQYYITDTVTAKRVKNLYSEQMSECAVAFDAYNEYGYINNICTLNKQPNTVLKVPKVLYKSLEEIVTIAPEFLYIGPLYGEYDALFMSESDFEAAEYDPEFSDEQREYFDSVIMFVQKGSISLELLEDNSVRLNIAPDYAAFSESYGDIAYIDFGWLKNAFIVDRISERLIEAGLTAGCISSFDGFARGLDDSGREYTVPMYKREGNIVSDAKPVVYNKPTSFVTYRNYNLNSRDFVHYYTYEDGTERCMYINPRTGRCECKKSTLCISSEEEGCAKIALSTAIFYITGETDTFTFPEKFHIIQSDD